MHTLISLSRTDPLHTLPLTTLLALYRAARRLASTSIRLQHNLRNVRMARMSRPLAVREAAQLYAMKSQRGKVRQHQRGAVEARVPRLCVCAVPFVARAERGSSALIVSVTAMRTLTMYSSEGFTERFG